MYNLLRSATRKKRLQILVGITEPGEERVRQALVHELLCDLRTGIDQDRRQAVMDLVMRLRNGHCSIFDGRAMPHHAKVYIIDQAVVVYGSANMSGNGLRKQIESGAVIEDQQQVIDFIRAFDRYVASPQCRNLNQDLLTALENWLRLASPWQVYLKTLLEVGSLSEHQFKRASCVRPVSYQNAVIARALSQLEEYRGAMIVASTGLGKTIMATDIALRLRDAGKLLNVLVIGPKPIEQEWRRHMDNVVVIWVKCGSYTILLKPDGDQAS